MFGGKLADRETLERISHFVSGCTSIVGGKDENFPHALAELLSGQGKKVLLVECVFDQVVRLSDAPGLWHYLEGKISACPVRKKSSYDYLPSGGIARHSAELVEKEAFASLLSSCKKEYHVVILYSSAAPFSTEAHTYMKYADKLIICTGNEPPQELQEYLSWSPGNLMFVYQT